MRFQFRRGLLCRAVVFAAAVGCVLVSGVGVAVAANGPALAWSPTTSAGSFSYAPLMPGQTTSQVFTLTNTSSSASAALTVTLAGSAFTKTADSCTGTSLGPDKSCQVTVRYAPTGYGQNDTATLTAVGKKAGAAASLTLQGTSVKAAPSVSTTPSAGGTVGATTVTDTAVVSGGSTPTGTVTFTLYGPSTTASCSGTPVDTETATVAGDNSYTTPSGAVPSRAGTYWWVAGYSGDAKNLGAVSSCGDESVVLAPASPMISTIPSAGGTVGASSLTDTAALTGGFGPTGTITFNLYAGSGCTGTPVFSSTEAVTGAGTYTSGGYANTTAGSYEWTAIYSGDPNNVPAASACGDEAVTVNRASPTLSTNPSAGGTVGASSLTDTATLTGGASPTGTVTFNLYAGSGCTGIPVLTSTEAVTGAGTYTSGGYANTTAGSYEWTAIYSGDPNNVPAASACGDEAVTVNRASPTLSTTPTPTSGAPGTTLTDTATLTGGASPTGTVTFNLYAGTGCTGTPVLTSTQAVTGAGTYASASYANAAAGSYEWTAAYSGDTNNAPAIGACGDEAVTVNRASPTLSTTPTPTSGAPGTTLTDTATLTGGASPTGTVTFNLYAGTGCTGTPVLTSTQAVTGAGTYTSAGYANAAAGSYEWTAAYSGDTNNAPAASACGKEPVGLLSAPTLVSPADGSVFSNFPRTATYTWQAVPGATSYLYQRLVCQPGGFTNCQPYPGGDTISVTGTSVTTTFIGGQPGEWRVIAVTANGIQGPPSAWWKFTWTV